MAFVICNSGEKTINLKKVSTTNVESIDGTIRIVLLMDNGIEEEIQIEHESIKPGINIYTRLWSVKAGDSMNIVSMMDLLMKEDNVYMDLEQRLMLSAAPKKKQEAVKHTMPSPRKQEVRQL